MKNRICQIFGIRYPIVSGGMVWCSGWRLAAAVSEAGDAHNADSRASTVIQYLIPYVRFIGSVLGIRDQR